MKKIFNLFILGMLVCSACIAQSSRNRHFDSYSPLVSSNQQIIEKVVNSGVFIIKQSYELADSADNRYGLNGEKAFGIDYSLAVKVKDGFLVSERTLRPWDYNPLYDEYRQKYSPKSFAPTYSEISEKARYDSITITPDSLKSLFSGLIYEQKSDLFFGDGFSVGGEIGENDGWIVWFTKKNDTDLAETTDLNLSIVKKSLTITPKNGNESYFYQVDSLLTKESIIGGIFVIPEVVSVGHLEIILCGIVCRIDNGWMLCCPFVKDQDFYKPEEIKETFSSKDEPIEEIIQELTPNQTNTLEIKPSKLK